MTDSYHDLYVESVDRHCETIRLLASLAYILRHPDVGEKRRLEALAAYDAWSQAHSDRCAANLAASDAQGAA